MPMLIILTDFRQRALLCFHLNEMLCRGGASTFLSTTIYVTGRVKMPATAHIKFSFPPVHGNRSTSLIIVVYWGKKSLACKAYLNTSRTINNRRREPYALTEIKKKKISRRYVVFLFWMSMTFAKERKSNTFIVSLSLTSEISIATQTAKWFAEPDNLQLHIYTYTASFF